MTTLMAPSMGLGNFANIRAYTMILNVHSFSDILTFATITLTFNFEMEIVDIYR